MLRCSFWGCYMYYSENFRAKKNSQGLKKNTLMHSLGVRGLLWHLVTSHYFYTIHLKGVLGLDHQHHDQAIKQRCVFLRTRFPWNLYSALTFEKRLPTLKTKNTPQWCQGVIHWYRKLLVHWLFWVIPGHPSGHWLTPNITRILVSGWTALNKICLS